MSNQPSTRVLKQYIHAFDQRFLVSWTDKGFELSKSCSVTPIAMKANPPFKDGIKHGALGERIRSEVRPLGVYEDEIQAIAVLQTEIGPSTADAQFLMQTRNDIIEHRCSADMVADTMLREGLSLEDVSAALNKSTEPA